MGLGGGKGEGENGGWIAYLHSPLKLALDFPLFTMHNEPT